MNITVLEQLSTLQLCESVMAVTHCDCMTPHEHRYVEQLSELKL